MIDVSSLSKTYGGGAYAVRDLSFSLKRGEVLGFLGPNGAGKTTTLRIMAGFLGASSGSVKVLGLDIAEDSLAARQMIGYMPESVPLYPEMRVREYLSFRASIKKVPRRARKDNVLSAMRRANVAHVAETIVSKLSKGYRQRVGLADALVANPPILILDEPTAGLDPNQIREVRALVRELGKEHAVIFSTHILPEVESVCDRAIVVAKGRLVAEGTIEQLRQLRTSSSLRLVVSNTERGRTIIGSLPGATGVELEQDGALRLHASADVSLTALAEAASRALVEANVGLSVLTPSKPTLEDIFTELTEPSP